MSIKVNNNPVVEELSAKKKRASKQDNQEKVVKPIPKEVSKKERKLEDGVTIRKDF
jgi:LDH2 family malate/lactate/ureidoglycolate dehydrogenase